MRTILDAKVDQTDDLIIQSDDLLIETNVLQTGLNVAGRRLVGRYDDTLLRESLCAGLERFLFSKNIYNSVYDIKSAIVKCLSRDNLFASNEYDIKVTKSENPREAKLYIVFKTPILNDASTFKIFIDTENQRVYRG